MDKLKELMDKCVISVKVEVNVHHDYYETVEQHLNYEQEPPEIAPEVLAEMIRLDRCIKITYYPFTPVSFNTIFHHDIDQAIDEALKDIARLSKKTRLI